MKAKRVPTRETTIQEVLSNFRVYTPLGQQTELRQRSKKVNIGKGALYRYIESSYYNTNTNVVRRLLFTTLYSKPKPGIPPYEGADRVGTKEEEYSY